jgi:hypothetical protein
MSSTIPTGPSPIGLACNRVFSCHVSDVPLPLPPTHVAAEYDAEGVLQRTPARFNYVLPSTTKVLVQRDPQGNDFASDDNGVATFTNPDPTWVYNGRRRSLRLHRNGFELLSPAPFPQEQDIDFLSRDQVLQHYYPHCQQLLQQYLGEDQVQVWAFDHNVRMGVASSVASSTTTTTVQKPLGIVHGDYTTVSGPRRLALLGEPPKINDIWRDRLPPGQSALLNDPDMVEECLQGRRRFALINVWRNIDRKHPVLTTPLACVDATSHADADLRLLELHYQDRTGGNYLVCPSEAHRWVYFPEMTSAEALLLKQWDSSGGHSDTTEDRIATFSLHSAFVDPVTPADAPPRQSIEVRCVAIWNAAVV